MTRDSIRQAALRRFAEQGFDGVSMVEIAGDVGIKAPAIYVHFKGKRELFLDVLQHVMERELAFTEQALAGAGEPESVLFAFLQDIGPRFEATPHLRFMLNAAYLPPRKVAADLAPPVRDYMNNMESIIHNAFRRLPPCRVPPEQLASAYMGIMDSIQAEVLYGGQHRFRKRLDALWAVFRLALPSQKA